MAIVYTVTGGVIETRELIKETAKMYKVKTPLGGERRVPKGVWNGVDTRFPFDPISTLDRDEAITISRAQCTARGAKVRAEKRALHALKAVRLDFIDGGQRHVARAVRLFHQREIIDVRQDVDIFRFDAMTVKSVRGRDVTVSIPVVAMEEDKNGKIAGALLVSLHLGDRVIGANLDLTD